MGENEQKQDPAEQYKVDVNVETAPNEASESSATDSGPDSATEVDVSVTESSESGDSDS